MKVSLSGLPEVLVPVNPHLQTGSRSISEMMLVLLDLNGAFFDGSVHLSLS